MRRHESSHALMLRPRHDNIFQEGIIMIKILTDSSSNITKKEADSMGITLLPLTVVFGDREYRDGIDIDATAFYDLLVTDKNHPHTSQINTAVFEDIFSAAKANGDTLLVLLISSALSGTTSAAIRAKEAVGYDKIYIYDTRNTTVMLKMLVEEAVRHADEPVEQVIAHLDDIRSRQELYAIVDTLEYLYKGGRMKRGTAAIGTLFHVKPVIEVTEEGTVGLAGKAIGTRGAIKHITKTVRAEDIDENYPFYYIFSAENDKCRELARAIHGERGDELVRHAENICPVIGVHVGPAAAGICFVRKK